MRGEVKQAFVGGALGALGKGLSSARKVIPAAAGNVAQTFQRATPGIAKGMGQTALSDAKWGAGIGGLLEGGVAAAGAAPGERTDAFLGGAARGAALGGVSGAASGAARQGMRNMRQTHLGNVAGKQMGTAGMDPMAKMTYAPAQGEAALNQPWTKDLVNSFTGKGPAGAAGSRFESLAAPATVIGDMAIGGAAYDLADKILPGGQAPEMPQKKPQYPSMPKQAEDQFTLPPIAGSIPGGFLGNRGGEYVLQKLEEAGKLSPHITGNKWLRGSLAPAMGMAGAGAGYGAVKSLQPEESTPPEIEALKNINLQALQRRYPVKP